MLELYFGNSTIEHLFDVVPNKCEIPSNGIIGKDFNKRFQCKIDYQDMSYAIRLRNSEIVVPISPEIDEETILPGKRKFSEYSK